MAGGSRKRESPEDRQCGNCGRFYNFRGLDEHEGSCSHPEWAEPFVPFEEGSPGDILDEADDHDRAEADVDDVDDLEDEPGELPEPTSATPALATDGGNPAFGAPEATPRADGGGDDEGDDEPECPECGGSRWFDPAEVAPGTAAAEYDCACVDCSSDAGWVVFNE